MAKKELVLKSVVNELKAEANEALDTARVAAAQAHSARRALRQYTGKYNDRTSEDSIQTAVMELYRAKTFSGFPGDLPPTNFN